MHDDSKLISQSEFARRIGTSPPTLTRWIKMGYIQPYVKTPSGRLKFTEEQVEDYYNKFKAEDKNHE